MSHERPEALTVEQVGNLLGISRSTIYKMAKAGQLTKLKLAGCTRFSRSEVEALAKGVAHG